MNEQIRWRVSRQTRRLYIRMETSSGYRYSGTYRECACDVVIECDSLDGAYVWAVEPTIEFQNWIGESSEEILTKLTERLSDKTTAFLGRKL